MNFIVLLKKQPVMLVTSICERRKGAAWQGGTQVGQLSAAVIQFALQGNNRQRALD